MLDILLSESCSDGCIYLCDVFLNSSNLSCVSNSTQHAVNSYVSVGCSRNEFIEQCLVVGNVLDSCLVCIKRFRCPSLIVTYISIDGVQLSCEVVSLVISSSLLVVLCFYSIAKFGNISLNCCFYIICEICSRLVLLVFRLQLGSFFLCSVK